MDFLNHREGAVSFTVNSNFTVEIYTTLREFEETEILRKSCRGDGE